MQEHGMYFGKNVLYATIRKLGGAWNDSKERPLVCLMKSSEHSDLYWAIPVGNWDHRTQEAKDRITKFVNCEDSDIRSCFYHLGKTDVNSIFFISDVIPVTDKYIEREYIGKYSQSIYIIKNKVLLAELERKLKRILAWENSQNNSYRQHITDVKNYLIAELNESKKMSS